MGYCEIMCQLCGVSFAIARLRRADEPAEAAWDYTGSDYVDEANGRDTFDDYCGDNTGCTLVERGPTFRPEDDSGEEHIAGPGCASCRGYCGYRISLEEMKGCRAVQCLIKKEEDWQPEADDQDFELASDYFLSGIGDGSPDESPLEDIMPARHGVDEMLIDNCLYGSRVSSLFKLFQLSIENSRLVAITTLEE